LYETVSQEGSLEIDETLLLYRDAAGDGIAQHLAYIANQCTFSGYARVIGFHLGYVRLTNDSGDTLPLCKPEFLSRYQPGE